MNFFHDNYLTWGWGSHIYGKRHSDDEKFWVEHGPCTQPPMDWRSECIRATDLIYQSTDKKIVVYYSGGIDSEIVCKSFIENGHPFEVLIAKYDNGINAFDFNNAIKFCKKFDIKYTVVEIDFQTFIESNFYPYRDKPYPNFSWAKNFIKYILDRGHGFRVMGDGDPTVIKDPANKLKIYGDTISVLIPSRGVPTRDWVYDEETMTGDLFYCEMEMDFELHSYMEDQDIDGVSMFYHYTPELLVSYIRNFEIQEWIETCRLNTLPDKQYRQRNQMISRDEYIEVLQKKGNCSDQNKQHIKYRHFPELEYRAKYTGPEPIKHIVEQYIFRVSAENGLGTPGHEMVLKPFDDFFNRVSGGF